MVQMTLHHPNNFDKEVRNLEREIVKPGETEYEIELPEPGKLYTMVRKSEGNQTETPTLQVTYISQGSFAEEGEIHHYRNPMPKKIESGNVFLVLDFLIEKLGVSNGSHAADVQINFKPKVAYSILCKFLYGQEIVYRGFLVTRKYNEFLAYFYLENNDGQMD